MAGRAAGLHRAGAGFDVFDVPGAFELPLAAKYLAESGRYDGVACLGAVIRGETDHYDYVCGEAARGIQDVQLATGVPCAFGVLTVDTMEQALARSGGGKRDQGEHAARPCSRWRARGVAGLTGLGAGPVRAPAAIVARSVVGEALEALLEHRDGGPRVAGAPQRAGRSSHIA